MPPSPSKTSVHGSGTGAEAISQAVVELKVCVCQLELLRLLNVPLLGYESRWSCKVPLAFPLLVHVKVSNASLGEVSRPPSSSVLLGPRNIPWLLMNNK